MKLHFGCQCIFMLLIKSVFINGHCVRYGTVLNNVQSLITSNCTLNRNVMSMTRVCWKIDWLFLSFVSWLASVCCVLKWFNLMVCGLEHRTQNTATANELILVGCNSIRISQFSSTQWILHKIAPATKLSHTHTLTNAYIYLSVHGTQTLTLSVPVFLSFSDYSTRPHQIYAHVNESIRRYTNNDRAHTIF